MIAKVLPDDPDYWTMVEHAEFWWMARGNTVPLRATLEYDKMYKEWHEFAFRNFPE